MYKLKIIEGNAEVYIQSPKRPRSIDYAIPIYTILSEYASTINSLMMDFDFILVWKFKEESLECLEYSANTMVDRLTKCSWEISSKYGRKHYAIVKMFSDEEPVSGDANWLFL